MTKSKRASGSDLARLDATTDEDIARQIAEDPDAAPELTEELLERAEFFEGDRFVRRVGRPQGSGAKELVTLRIDREVLAHFRATGPGWQTRMNDALRASLPKPAAARHPRRGSNARLVEEVLQSSSPRALHPAEIRNALQRDKGVAMAFTSIRHALDQLETRDAAEQVGDTKTWRQSRVASQRD